MPTFKTYHIATQAGQCGGGGRVVTQPNRTENPEASSHTWSKSNSVFEQTVLEQLDIHRQRNGTTLMSHLTQKLTQNRSQT